MGVQQLQRSSAPWVLSSSGHQVVWLNGGTLALSRQFDRKKAARTLSENVQATGHWEANPPATLLAVNEIVGISADAHRRALSVETASYEMQLIGFPFAGSGRKADPFARLKRPRDGSRSPAHEAAEEFAEAAGLELRSDPRAQVRHYVLPGTPEYRFTPTGIDAYAGSVRVRPWRDALIQFLVLAWMLAWLGGFSGLLSRIDPLRFFSLGLTVFTLLAFLSMSVLRTITGVVVNTEGIRGAGWRWGTLTWTDIELLHATSYSNNYGKRVVEIVPRHARPRKLGSMTSKQANAFAEALARYGEPHGVVSSVYADDLVGKRADGLRVIKSPLETGLFTR